MNIENIINRLKQHLEVETDTEVARNLGVSLSALSNWKKRNKINFNLIFNKLQSINYHWLITGQKSSLSPKLDVESEIISISTKDFLFKQNQGQRLPIVIIPEKASAGYLAGFSDENSLELEIVSFKNYQNGNRFRCFEISGDSMEASIKSGDCVLCEKIEDKQSLKDGNMYIFCTQEGILCKRLEIKQEQLVLHSDNEKYSPKYIDKEQVSEFWKVIWIHRELK